MFFSEENCIGLEPLHIILKITIICILTHNNGPITFIGNIDDFSEGVFGLVEGQQIR